MIGSRSMRMRRLDVVGMALGTSLLFGMPAAADTESHRPASESFLLHCSGCHQSDGRGTKGVAPDLRKIGVLLDLEGGRHYLGSVPGVAQAPIGDEELAHLLTWVLTEIAHRAPEPAYTAEEIRRLRAEPLRDPIAARKALFRSDS
jgi:mono/diheme cytochrome c family protein